MPLDPNDYDAKLGYQEDGWYGIASPSQDHPGYFSIRRLASHEHAENVSNGTEDVPVILSPPRGGGRGSTILLPPAQGKRSSVCPMVHSHDNGANWYFSAAGWRVPNERDA